MTTLTAAVAAVFDAADPVPQDVVDDARAAILARWRMLTVRQPWASWIALSGKSVENRTWAPKDWRGPLLIHAGLKLDRDARDQPTVPERLPGPRLYPLGAIVASVRLESCHECKPDCCDTQWAERSYGVWHWVLADVRPLAEPVPATGALGLRRPSADVLDAVLRQLEAVPR